MPDGGMRAGAEPGADVAGPRVRARLRVAGRDAARADAAARPTDAPAAPVQKRQRSASRQSRSPGRGAPGRRDGGRRDAVRAGEEVEHWCARCQFCSNGLLDARRRARAPQLCAAVPIAYAILGVAAPPRPEKTAIFELRDQSSAARACAVCAAS